MTTKLAVRCTALVSLIVLVVSGCGMAAKPTPNNAGSAKPTTAGQARDSVPVAEHKGPVPLDGTYACAGNYSEDDLGNATMAFDGTVRSIAKDGQNVDGMWMVTFDVDAWYVGPSAASSAHVAIFPTVERASGESYELGTRMLVSGDANADGDPLTGHAWACGFTRYYDAATARAWSCRTIGCGADTQGDPPPISTTSARCVELYEPDAVANRGFAFDGVVRHIADRGDDLGYVDVTFTVSEWFRGPPQRIVTIDMFPPGATESETSVAGGDYDLGSRLLVSGEPRWGGEALDGAVAWPCGFTRQFDTDTAARWRASTASDTKCGD